MKVFLCSNCYTIYTGFVFSFAALGTNHTCFVFYDWSLFLVQIWSCTILFWAYLFRQGLLHWDLQFAMPQAFILDIFLNPCRPSQHTTLKVLPNTFEQILFQVSMMTLVSKVSMRTTVECMVCWRHQITHTGATQEWRWSQWTEAVEYQVSTHVGWGPCRHLGGIRHCSCEFPSLQSFDYMDSREYWSLIFAALTDTSQEIRRHTFVLSYRVTWWSPIPFGWKAASRIC